MPNQGLQGTLAPPEPGRFMRKKNERLSKWD